METRAGAYGRGVRQPERCRRLSDLPDAEIGCIGLGFKALGCSNNDVDAWVFDPVSGERKPLPPLESGALDAVFKDLPACPPRPIDRVLLIRNNKDKPAR